MGIVRREACEFDPNGERRRPTLRRQRSARWRMGGCRAEPAAKRVGPVARIEQAAAELDDPRDFGRRHDPSFSRAITARACAVAERESAGPNSASSEMIFAVTFIRSSARRATNSPRPEIDDRLPAAPGSRPSTCPIATAILASWLRAIASAAASASLIVEHLAIGADRPGQPVAGRLFRGRAAVGRVRAVRLLRQIAERQIGVPGRGKQFMRGRALLLPPRERIHQRADRASLDARIDQLAGQRAAPDR